MLRGVFWLLAVALLLAPLGLAVDARAADDDKPRRKTVRSAGKYRNDADDRRYNYYSGRARARDARDEEEYAARADEADPSKSFGAYPNWARAAIGTKPYSR